MKKITKADVKAFFTLDRKDVVQLAIMAGVIIMGSDISFAQDANVSGTTSMSTLSTPINNIREFMSGTVAKSFATIGAVVFGASWAMNIENQITKAGMRIAGGSATAIGATNFINDATGFLF